MTRGCDFLAKLTQITKLVASLPEGADVVITWSDAPPDLMLVLAQQEGGELRQLGDTDEVQWSRGGLTIPAQRQTAPTTRPTLTVVR